jgi:hypothetical protein
MKRFVQITMGICKGKFCSNYTWHVCMHFQLCRVTWILILFLSRLYGVIFLVAWMLNAFLVEHGANFRCRDATFSVEHGAIFSLVGMLHFQLNIVLYLAKCYQEWKTLHAAVSLPYLMHCSIFRLHSFSLRITFHIFNSKFRNISTICTYFLYKKIVPCASANVDVLWKLCEKSPHPSVKIGERK